MRSFIPDNLNNSVNSNQFQFNDQIINQPRHSQVTQFARQQTMGKSVLSHYDNPHENPNDGESNKK